MKGKQLLFLLLFLVVAFYYGFWEILPKAPQSIHYWRQTDATSIVLNYYQKDANPLHPEVLYQCADEGKSGYAVSEFPGYYYFMAGLWKIFGQSHLIYRLVSLLIFFLGMFHLFKLCQKIKMDAFWSYFIAFSFFTSTVLVFYAANFTTDVPAFSLALIGSFYLYDHWERNRIRLLILAMVFFTLAGLTKIVALMPFFAFFGTYLLLALRNNKSERKDFPGLKFNWKKTLAYSSVIVIVGAWYAYAFSYNAAHKTTFFSTKTYPIWNLKNSDISRIWQQINHVWRDDYFNFSSFVLFGLMILFSIFRFKKADIRLKTIVLLLLAQSVLYVSLWFFCFENHDYYFIHLLYFFIFLSIFSFQTLQERHPKLAQSWILKVVLLLVLVSNTYYAKFRMDKRYKGWGNEYPTYRFAHQVRPYLRSIGIKPEDKVISLPDIAPNYTLYLFQQRGWTQAFNDNLSADQIKKNTKLGAKYLICVGDEVLTREYLQPFLKRKIGQYGDVRIFLLPQ